MTQSAVTQALNVRKAIATGDYRVVNKAREAAHSLLKLKKIAPHVVVQQKAVPVAVSVDTLKKSLPAHRVKAH